MKDSFVSAKAVNLTTIKILFFTSLPMPRNFCPSLIIDDGRHFPLKIVKQISLNNLFYFDCETKEELQLGHHYDVACYDFGIVPVNLSDLSSLEGFDKKYYYDGDDLGATIKNGKTSFVVWTPLSSKVFLNYFYKGDWHTKEMARETSGVYRLVFDENLGGAKYYYYLDNGSKFVRVTDPYAKGSTANGEESVVIDFDSIGIDLEEKDLPTYKSYTETIIYEAHVRDLTIDPNTNITFKGTYAGLCETGKTTKLGHPAGIDYIKYLGITHIQLLPIYDYKSVDELNPLKGYNWGYDPAQYFVPEGGMCTNILDPYSRIKEVKNMVKAFHHAKIKVNMDVVFNHVFEHEFSVFEKIVPNYYFRRKNNGTMSNGSFCGNDLATDRPMVRKLIVDCCLFWIKEYGIDGYRFDLAGIIDIETMNEIKEKGFKLKKDLMLYGEGWNMPTELDNAKKTTIDNAFKVPYFGFFNDFYRDTLKGPTSSDRIKDWGYLLGNTDLIEAFKFSYIGSCIDFCYHKRFASANQSINYVECHDNHTLYDKLEIARPGDSIETRYRRIKSFNASILCSFGVPFFHMGQEIGLSKKHDENSYRSGDAINSMKWNEVDERFEMVDYFKGIAEFRKAHSFFATYEPGKIDELVDLQSLESGVTLITFLTKVDQYNDLTILVNPTDVVFYYDFDEYYEVIVGNTGEIENSKTYVKNVMVQPNSLLLLARKDNENV